MSIDAKLHMMNLTGDPVESIGQIWGLLLETDNIYSSASVGAIIMSCSWTHFSKAEYQEENKCFVFIYTRYSQVYFLDDNIPPG